MEAVFRNRLTRVEKRQTLQVEFKHGFDAPVRTWFEASDNNPFGWIMQFECKNDALLKEFKEDIFRRGIKYIEKRADDEVKQISFNDIQGMADALEIKSVER
jgi:hypothetical protein